MGIIKNIVRFFTTSPKERAEEKQLENTTPSKPKKTDSSNNYYAFLENICNNSPALQNSYQFVIGAEHIYINGKGDANALARAERSADAIIKIEPRLFTNMMKKRTPFVFIPNPEVKTKGDVGAIMKIEVLLNNYAS